MTAMPTSLSATPGTHRRVMQGQGYTRPVAGSFLVTNGLSWADLALSCLLA